MNDEYTLDPRYIDAYISRACLLRDRGEHIQALGDLSVALHLDSTNIRALCLRAQVRCELGKLGEAMDDASFALRLDPTNIEALGIRGNIYCRQNDSARALSDFEAVCKLDPNNVDARSTIAYICVANRDWKRSSSELSSVIKLDPKNRRALMVLATIQAMCPDSHYRDGNKALENAETYGGLCGWKDPNCYLIQAAAYAELGQFDEAIRSVKKAMEDMAFMRANAPWVKRCLEMYERRAPLRLE